MDRRPHGHQNDGAGDLWCAIARTEHGRIPGKAQGDTCWYPYGGEEHSTDNFRVIKSHKKRAECTGKPQGHQNDGSGDLWCAVAFTEHGKIPGKAKDDSCWYSYGGEERQAEEFKWVCKQSGKKSAMSHGYQDDCGEVWCAVANTEHGKIPGKAKDGTCWYPFGGEEHTTDDFKLIKSHKFSEECHGKAQGHQEEGGKLWCAVANTEWGAIPGKAKDGECWYPYAGGEHSTSDFRYVCSGKPEDHEGSSSSSESSDSSCSSSSSSSSEESEKEEEPEEEEEEEEVEEVEEEEEGDDSEDEENEKDDDHDKRGAALRALMGIVGRPVAIKGCNGKYLRNVHHPLLCFDANKIGLWEQFMILPLDNGQVFIQSLRDGRNVSMNCQHKVGCNNTNQKEWERFNLEHDVENDNWFFVNEHQGGHVWNCGPSNGYSHAPNCNRLGHEAMKIEVVQNPSSMEKDIKLQKAKSGLQSMKFNF